MATLFISDLHLDPARPAATAALLHLLERETGRGNRLCILGDLFEAWIGDDDDAAWLAPIRTALATLTAAGTECALMHGNRDFLIGERFARETGITLLDEYKIADLDGTRVLLTHGDLLCTDDTRYMTLRAQLRNPAWQTDFLSKPLAERRRIAQELRALSRTEMAAKSDDIMDVNRETVDATMRRFGVTTLIHGHTHRPAFHRWTLDDEPALRIDLGDWYDTASTLIWDTAGPRRETLSG